MIIGIGTDLLEIARVKAILAQPSGERFLQRVLTDKERELASQKRGRFAEFTAGRFAAKEAVVKALGCGIGKEVTFRDVEVLPDAKGKPVCRLSAVAWERLARSAGQALCPDGNPAERLQIHVSITHTETMAMAYSVVER
ncbi:holo-ACP synthase [Paenibacillus allorhizosphaerae]|uniref:Holo-[acyl-carrier-protein] synthase n=1 Tax=Paenibacillus allorhizosphaerae TaxID=2849866 RepID=A0ABM8VMC2_9BACL|nr:holo-ACP synthase [Paenibacillus allorhizosphaerae]CAG7649823.1 Holo-[acyl-carrier-protein] synthase [Paenibacillus allorhizosphaerae]